MAGFLKIYLSCLILTGISGCKSGENSPAAFYTSNNYTPVVTERQLDAKRFSANKSTAFASVDLLTAPDTSLKTLTAQSTNSTSNASLNWDVDKDGTTAVSYTHLTLPTICSV